MGYDQCWLDGQRLGNMTGNLVTKIWGRNIWTDFPEQVRNMKIFVPPVNAPQRIILAEEDFNTQFTNSVNTNQSSPVNPIIIRCSWKNRLCMGSVKCSSTPQVQSGYSYPWSPTGQQQRLMLSP